MPTRRATGIGLAVLVAAAGVVIAAPAAHGASARSALTLSVRVSGEKTRTRTLRCDPPGGTHPRATGACADLTAAKGDPGAIKPKQDVMCTMIYRPATATAKGTWRGRVVKFTHTYSNSCVLGTQTGAVFQF
jgi:Subtilisin inhibitor-like